MDLYKILELTPNANENDIRKAYIRLAKKHHPDKNKDPEAVDKFQKIQSAYEILINSDTRIKYQNMTNTEKYNFIKLIEKIMNQTIHLEDFTNYICNLKKTDMDYIKNNFCNFFKYINTNELMNLFKNGVVSKKTINTNNDIDTDTDMEIYDNNCEYYYELPIITYGINNLDIRVDLNININDINNKKKIKIKRNINNTMITSTYIFNTSHPYIIFYNLGDIMNDESGNLIIILNLPNNIYWNNNIILFEYPMNLYQMIYGIDININIGNEIINIDKWFPSKNGNIIDISNKISKLSNYNINIRLFLEYDYTEDNEKILKYYFSN